MPFVADASVTLSWCFADEATPYSRAVLGSLATTHAVAPALWPFEVANALASAQRRDRITAKGIDLFLEQLRQLPIHVERREALWLCKAAIALAREHSLSAYDAAYLELAKREGLPLATLDETLRRAAQLAGVAILAFS